MRHPVHSSKLHHLQMWFPAEPQLAEPLNLSGSDPVHLGQHVDDVLVVPVVVEGGEGEELDAVSEGDQLPVGVDEIDAVDVGDL